MDADARGMAAVRSMADLETARVSRDVDDRDDDECRCDVLAAVTGDMRCVMVAFAIAWQRAIAFRDGGRG